MSSPDVSAVKAELERVLTSKIFQKSTVLSNFLRYVVTETLEDKTLEIKEYSIAVKALGKPANFNPQLDSLIRIHAGRLRRNLLEYYRVEGCGDPITITFIKGSYIPAFLPTVKLNGSVVEIPISKAPTNLTTSRVAVLPFKNLSGSKENDFMINGFCEQLSSDLGQFPEIAVLAYFSTLKFKGEQPDIREVGTELNTSHLITGSIYRDKKHLRISMQLVNASTGSQVWTHTYDRTLQSTYPYEIFDDIIKQVVPKLIGLHGLISRNFAMSTQVDPSMDQHSLDAVFWYYHYEIKYTEEVFQTARQKIEQSLHKSPDNAMAWAIMAQLYIDGIALCYETVTDPIHEANICIQKAMQLDPDCQHASMSLTWVFIFQRDKNAAMKALDKMLSINERSPFHMGAACFFLGILGEYEKSIDYFKKSTELNPYYSWWVNLGPFFAHFYSGDYEQALQFANLINIPGVFWNLLPKIAALGQLSRLDEVSVLVEEFQIQFPGMETKYCQTLKTILFHELVHDRIKEGLSKAGLDVQNKAMA
ncbi:tetratricopeptide repeat protein [Flavitalea sp.]|nr:hypothetical protein [Flavitalea sp.]